jgi:hypothetical protein
MEAQNTFEGYRESAEVFAEWLRRQGHRVIRTESSYWADHGPRIYQAFPYHLLIRPNVDDIGKIFRTFRALGIRYSAPIDDSEGRLSYHVVLPRREYGLECLGETARHNIRRGLRNCTVEQITLERLSRDGWQLRLDTLARQGRKLDISRKKWTTLCAEAASLPGFEAWGALVSNDLVASILVFHMNDCAYLLYPQSLTATLKLHANNALAYMLTDSLLKRDNVETIFYGLHSLDAPPSVDEFKLRMGYLARPVRQRVRLHPYLAFAAGRPLYNFLGQIRRLAPRSVMSAKAEGMIRFYLEGKLPLAQQEVPLPLTDDRRLLKSELGQM